MHQQCHALLLTLHTVFAQPCSLFRGSLSHGFSHCSSSLNSCRCPVLFLFYDLLPEGQPVRLLSAGTAKIADVGLARIMQHTLSNTATGDPAGTFAYAAPEMLMGEKWDDKVLLID